jgi:hypothetical protein
MISRLSGLLLSLSVFAACRNAGSSDASADLKDRIVPPTEDRFDSSSLNVKISPAQDTFPALDIKDSSLPSLSFPNTIDVPLDTPLLFHGSAIAIFIMASKPRIDTLNVVPYRVSLTVTTIEKSYSDSRAYVFKKPFVVRSCTFVSGHSLLFSAFDSMVAFNDNDYQNGLDVESSIFRDTTIFANPPPSYLNCSFAGCTFKKGLICNDRFSKGNSYFKTGYFSVEEPVEGSHFKNNLTFDRCRIQGKLDLSECHFDSGSRFIFIHTPLPDTLDLDNTKLTASIDLTGAKLQDIDKKCQINLMGCDIEKLKLGYGNFHLYIPDSLVHDKYSRDQISATYEALLNNFQKNGFKDSYRTLALEYKGWQAKHDFSTRISGIWWGYGYRKWQLLIWTFGFLLVFSLLNQALYKRIFSTYPIDELAMDGYDFSPNQVIKFFQQLLISAMYTGWIFFKLSIDFDKIKIQRLGWLFIILIEYLIGILCTAYLINWIVSK